MDTLNRLHILEGVLSECGYSDWHVVEATSFADTSSLSILKGKNSLISIPNEWLNDPHERKTIRESLAMTIETLQ